MVLTIIVGLLFLGPGKTDSTALGEAVRTAIVDRAKAMGEEVVIESIRFPRLVPSTDAGTIFVEPLPIGRWGGHLVVMVDLGDPGTGMKRVPVSCTVRTFAEAYTAAHRLERHAGLSKNDIALSRVETTHLPEDYLRAGFSPGRVRTQRIIQEGAVLCAGMLEPEPTVRAGDPVTLLTRANGVRVSVSAIAREDGRTGAVITVQQNGGHLRFRGRVIDANTVEREAE